MNTTPQNGVKMVVRRAEVLPVTITATVAEDGSGEIVIEAFSVGNQGKLKATISVQDNVLDMLLKPSFERHLVEFLCGDPRREVPQLLVEVHRELERMLIAPADSD